MKIQVDWYKESGKWYTGGLVEIGEYRIWEPEFRQAIVNNQNELMDTWVNHNYYVVCQSTPDQDNDPDFTGFYHCLLTPDTFRGMRKSTGAHDVL